MTEISKSIESFLSFLRETEQLHRISIAIEQEENDKTQDILHSLELEEHNYHHYARLAKDLKGVRQRRRDAKDDIELTAPVVAWLENNQTVVRSMEQLLGDVRKAERRLENRTYTPRVNV